MEEDSDRFREDLKRAEEEAIALASERDRLRVALEEIAAINHPDAE